jgi:hypothetical protein
MIFPHRARRLLLPGVVLAACVTLSSCWIPEKFDATVNINKDGSYTFIYDGTLTYAPALAAAKEGKLGPKDEAELQKQAVELRKKPEFKSVDYLGSGRYKVLVEKHGKVGEAYYFISEEEKIVSVIPHKDGTLTVKGVRPDDQAIKQLDSIGAKIDGTLNVSVAYGVKVVKQNADSEPMLFGLLGAYKWQINSAGADPLIVVQPSS